MLMSMIFRSASPIIAPRQQPALRRSVPVCVSRYLRDRLRRYRRARRFRHCGLNRRLAALLPRDPHAARIGRLRDRRDEVADLLRMIWIAHIECAHTRIEEGNERDLLVIHRGHAFIRRMRAEAATALAERAI